ncbi:MAG: ABC transporter ATP-binding protein [Saccharofermentanales bacterium]
MTDMIYCKDICKDYTTGQITKRVLSDVNIEVREASLTLLKGRSGSGKTTLMNILGALDNPTSGDVFYGDRNLADFTNEQKDLLRRREIAFVFQSIALLSHLSAYDNVEFMLRIAKLPVDRARIEYCLELVGLKERMKHLAPMLSGGEQQRVAIARALVHKPKIIFADEPTSQLDSTTSTYVMKLFKQFIKEDKISVLATSHDERVAEAADYIYTIEDGHIMDLKINI